MQTHVHEESGDVVEGLQLAPGAIVRPGDVFAAADGNWRFLPCSFVLGNSLVKWVRPRGDLSQSAREVLLLLTDREKRPKFIHVFQHTFAIACHNDFNSIDWPRTKYPLILNPDTLRELIDYGYIEQQQVFGSVYGVTELGHQRAAQLRQQN